ncbi:MAG TPA: hypothetical protein VLS90_09200, partial [Thermodesulfobacteriota bacterium]|nr:hypothetical protein [Thermodesulfobacteriota bacterium]
MKHLAAGLLACALVACLPWAAWCEGDVVEQTAGGEINWSRGVIVARGSGAPPAEAKNIAQARLMTERAALADARRNLLEVLREVRVDSATRVENFVLKDDRIRVQAEGLIQGSVEMKELRRYLSDGSIEVTVALNLSGDFLTLLLASGEPKRGQVKGAEPKEAKDPGPAPPAQSRGIGESGNESEAKAAPPPEVTVSEEKKPEAPPAVTT